MVNFKKAQSGSSAAILIAVIAAMILLYVLFLPPEERARILDDTNGNAGSKINSTNSILLKEFPGRLDLLKKRTIEHKISSFSLVSVTESKLIKDLNSVYAEKSDFSEKPLTLQFDMEDVENADNVILSFFVKDASGNLMITLNGNLISETSFEKGTNGEPIKLPKNMLSKTNTLKFQVSSPGILFFKTNRYDLTNVKIYGDVTDKTGLTNTQNIFLTSQEDEFLEKGTLSFMPGCKQTETSKLQVSVNDQELYSGIPTCYYPVKIEISPGRLLSGENRVTFSSEKGKYSIDQITYFSNLKELITPTYYFEVSEDLYKSVQNNSVDINMTVTFVKSTDFQDVEVELNGRKFSIDNKKRIYTENIDSYIREENNAITLRPLDGAVEVVELKIQSFNNCNNNDDDLDNNC